MKHLFAYVNPAYDAPDPSNAIGSFISYYNYPMPHQHLRSVPPCRFFHRRHDAMLEKNEYFCTDKGPMVRSGLSSDYRAAVFANNCLWGTL